MTEELGPKIFFSLDLLVDQNWIPDLQFRVIAICFVKGMNFSAKGNFKIVFKTDVRRCDDFGIRSIPFNRKELLRCGKRLKSKGTKSGE